MRCVCVCVAEWVVLQEGNVTESRGGVGIAVAAVPGGLQRSELHVVCCGYFRGCVKAQQACNGSVASSNAAERRHCALSHHTLR